jgi:hypothetical protein
MLNSLNIQVLHLKRLSVSIQNIHNQNMESLRNTEGKTKRDRIRNEIFGEDVQAKNLYINCKS